MDVFDELNIYKNDLNKLDIIYKLKNIDYIYRVIEGISLGRCFYNSKELLKNLYSYRNYIVKISIRVLIFEFIINCNNGFCKKIVIRNSDFDILLPLLKSNDIIYVLSPFNQYNSPKYNIICIKEKYFSKLLKIIINYLKLTI